MAYIKTGLMAMKVCCRKEKNSLINQNSITDLLQALVLSRVTFIPFSACLYRYLKEINFSASMIRFFNDGFFSSKIHVQ
jgi:hypothetical protein